jgi:hypothetical protein
MTRSLSSPIPWGGSGLGLVAMQWCKQTQSRGMHVTSLALARYNAPAMVGSGPDRKFTFKIGQIGKG